MLAAELTSAVADTSVGQLTSAVAPAMALRDTLQAQEGSEARLAQVMRMAIPVVFAVGRMRAMAPMAVRAAIMGTAIPQVPTGGAVTGAAATGLGRTTD